MSHSEITNLGKASLKRGLPPCEDHVMQGRQKVRASTSRYFIQDLETDSIARDAKPLRGKEPSKLISGPGGSRIESAGTAEPLLDQSIRLQAAESMLIANGINPQALHPQQLANFANAPPAAQQKSIATYLQNLESHEMTPAVARNTGSAKVIDVTISRDNTAGDQAR
ncbi:hypothetical protein ACLX1H_008209 [Fusarium chlamydosporum]